jgi:hypothetical protein
MSETCRVSFQNKFEKLVQLVGFIVGENVFTSQFKTAFGISSVESSNYTAIELFN